MMFSYLGQRGRGEAYVGVVLTAQEEEAAWTNSDQEDVPGQYGDEKD